MLNNKEDNKLYIFYQNELVAEHKINSKKSINYKEEHYKKSLINKFKDDEEIERITAKNLAKFKDLGEK